MSYSTSSAKDRTVLRTGISVGEEAQLPRPPTRTLTCQAAVAASCAGYWDPTGSMPVWSWEYVSDGHRTGRVTFCRTNAGISRFD